MAEIATRRSPAVPSTDWMRAQAVAARFILHGPEAARVAAAPVWGVNFSDQACRALVLGTRATLWLGPEEYLLLDRADPANTGDQSTSASSGVAVTAAALERALSATAHALVDISHRQFALEISGPQAVRILNGACPLDLDVSEFPVGMCTRTVLAKAEIVLWRTRTDAFHVEVWRSFGGYVTGLLGEIAREFYPET